MFARRTTRDPTIERYTHRQHRPRCLVLPGDRCRQPFPYPAPDVLPRIEIRAPHTSPAVALEWLSHSTRIPGDRDHPMASAIPFSLQARYLLRLRAVALALRRPRIQRKSKR